MPDEYRKDEWPMDSYAESWRLFRSMSDENARTGKHLVSLPSWPSKNNLEIVDIGCGDGKVLVQAIKASERVERAWLIDPYPQLLVDAKAELRRESPNLCCVPVLGACEETLKCLVGFGDVFLAVHLLYLLPNGGFECLLRDLPVGKPLYIVMDAPDSVHSRLWSRTAKLYHDRTNRARKKLDELSRTGWSVSQTRIESSLTDPYGIDDVGIRRGVLALLTYCDEKELGDGDDKDLREYIRAIIESKKQLDGTILLETVCYEVVKTAAA